MVGRKVTTWSVTHSPHPSIVPEVERNDLGVHLRLDLGRVARLAIRTQESADAMRPTHSAEVLHAVLGVLRVKLQDLQLIRVALGFGAGRRVLKRLSLSLLLHLPLFTQESRDGLVLFVR